MSDEVFITLLERLEADEQPRPEFAAQLRQELLTLLIADAPPDVPTPRPTGDGRPMLHWRRRPLAAVAAVVTIAVGLIAIVASRPPAADAWSVIARARTDYSSHPAYVATVSMQRTGGVPSRERVQRSSDGKWRITRLSGTSQLANGQIGAGGYAVFDGRLLGVYRPSVREFTLTPDERTSNRLFDPLSPNFWGFSTATGLPTGDAALRSSCRRLPDQTIADRLAHHVRCGAGVRQFDIWLDARFGTLLRFTSRAWHVQVDTIRYRPRFAASVFSTTPPAGSHVIYTAMNGVTPRRYRVETHATRTVSLHGHTVRVLAANHSVWVSVLAHRRGRVGRIDPGTGRVLAHIPAGFGALAAGFGDVWSADESHDVVYRIDPASNRVTARIHIQAWAAGLVTAAGRVWAVMPFSQPRSALAVINPATNRMEKTVPVGNESERVMSADGYVWTTSTLGGTISKIDPRTSHVVSTLHVAPGLLDIAAGAGSIWVTAGYDQRIGSLMRIDPATGKTTARIPVTRPSGLAVIDRIVWVLNGDSDTATLIDPATNRIVTTFPVGGGPTSLATLNGSVWITDNRDGTVVRFPLNTGGR